MAPKGNCLFVRSAIYQASYNATCLTAIAKRELIAVTLYHPYRVRRCPSDVGDYGFAFIRWTLNAIAILMVSVAMFVGVFISSLMHGLG
jgi:hypothetical protein